MRKAFCVHNLVDTGVEQCCLIPPQAPRACTPFVPLHEDASLSTHKTCMHAMVDSQPHPAKAQDPVSRHDLRSNSKTGVNGSQRAGSSTKKNGAGGKGTWGKLGDEYKATHVMDKGDPNYDDEAEAAVFEASS